MGNEKLSQNALEIAENRYFMDGETWSDMAERVGTEVATAEYNDRSMYGEKFSEMLYNMDFLAGGRILRNARRARGSMFNCYVLPIGDSIEEIGQFMKDALILWSEGGGVGCNLSFMRPRGAIIKGKGGTSSGPVSFAEAADALSKTIEAGGSRRAAALACMAVTHPDILEFIDAKLTHNRMSGFNISVAITEDFLEAVENNVEWQFKFAQQDYGKMPAVEIWDKIIKNMIDCAEPGLLNWDNVTSNNSYYFDPILSTNPSLRKGTKILTGDGIIPIEKLDQTMFSVPSIKGSYSEATCFLSGKSKNLYKIELQGGHCYYATAEHKWPTVVKDRWNYELNDFNKKCTDELKPNDYLPLPTRKTCLDYGHLGTYEDGFLIGWNIGDGWISNNDRPAQLGFIVAKEDQEYGIDTLLSNKLTELGWTGSFREVNGNKEVNVQNKKVRSFFDSFGTTKKEFGIPGAIWDEASEEFRKGFIDALFSADGYVDPKVKRIILTSSHEKLANDVSELLGFYGIYSSIKHTVQKNGTFPNGKTYEREYHRYDLLISRQSAVLQFYNVFKLTHKRKQDNLNTIVSNFDLVPSKNAIKVISVEKTDLFEDVWDITVSDDVHCFELSHVVTGNCGEATLGSYGICDLGSLVLPNFITGTINTNWKKLEEVIRLAVRFLDDVIDVNKYALKEVDINAHNSRRIGIGVMGLAEYLFAKKLRYGSRKAVYEVERLMRFIRDISYDESIALSVEKGSFPKYDTSSYSKAHFVRSLPASVRMKIKEYGIRNVTTMAFAPTGTISLLPEVTSGIEPLFRKAYMRHDSVSDRMYVHSLFKELLEDGSKTPDWFVDTDDLKPEDHFETQVAVQKFVDGAVSKTINMPAGTTAEDLSKLTLEYIHDLKGVTVYVDGSRENQILNKVPLKDIKAHLKNQKDTQGAGVEAVQCPTGSCEL